MKNRSARRGKRTSGAEVTNISRHGVWLLLRKRELSVPFERFPWFEDASIASILDVEEQGPGHLYWPSLDIDVAVESIEKPEDYPLVSRVVPKRVARRPANSVRRARRD